MVLLPDDEMRTEYDEEVQSYYVIWWPPATVGLGLTEQEALEDLRAAAHFGIDTTVDLKLAEVDRNGEVKNGKQD